MKRRKITVVTGMLLITVVIIVIVLSYNSGNYKSYKDIEVSEWIDPPDDNVVISGQIDGDFIFTQDELDSLELPVSYMKIPEDYEYDYNVYNIVAMALDKYFDGNVPEVFDFDFQRDLGIQETNLIFNVRVCSDNYTLNMLLDMYGLKVVVSE